MELQTFLLDLGYNYGGKSDSYINDKCEGMIYCYYDMYYIVNQVPARSHMIIDCHSNEETFKGVAAINDFNDYMQWFLVPEFNGNLITYKPVKYDKRDRGMSDSIEESLLSGSHKYSIPIKLKYIDVIDLINNKK